MLVSYLNENGWDIIDTQNIEPRDKQLLLHNDLNVSEQAKLFLKNDIQMVYTCIKKRRLRY